MYRFYEMTNDTFSCAVSVSEGDQPLLRFRFTGTYSTPNAPARGRLSVELCSSFSFIHVRFEFNRFVSLLERMRRSSLERLCTDPFIYRYESGLLFDSEGIVDSVED